MIDLGTRILETERLLLRKIVLDDVDAMFHNWAKDRRVSKYVSWAPHKDKSTTKSVIENWVKAYSHPHTYHWIVVEKCSGIPFGTISVVEKSLKDETCEVGYCYGSRWWDEGYGTEALKAVLEYLIKDVGFFIVEAKHMESNPASGKVMQKAGMHYECTLKNRCMNRETGNRESLLLYAMTKNDC